MTREEEIKRVHSSGTHMVLLGAGASFASTLRNSEKNGKRLPLMKNIVEIIGLDDIVRQLPQDLKNLSGDFEKLYSSLCEYANFEDERLEIENRVHDYFRQLQLPDEPTIYDYIILSLRQYKDVIATFNWDPFLFQAYNRNAKFVESPGVLFLHGNVAIGYNANDGSSGAVGMYDAKGDYYEPTKLLYPVGKKDYNSDAYIKSQWEGLSEVLKIAQRVTIFGYSAPVSDVEAIQLLQQAWGTPDERNMEQFELVDIRPEIDVRASWDSFIHSHHYYYHDNFFNSSLVHHPRRTVEIYRAWSMPRKPSDSFPKGNPVPINFRHIEEMWEWFVPLIEAEREHGSS